MGLPSSRIVPPGYSITIAVPQQPRNTLGRNLGPVESPENKEIYGFPSLLSVLLRSKSNFHNDNVIVFQNKSTAFAKLCKDQEEHPPHLGVRALQMIRFGALTGRPKVS